MASLLLCGTLSAQNWGTPDSHAQPSNTPIVASVTIDGEAVTASDALRLGAFVGDELRGIAAQHDDENFWIQVFYTDENDDITFKFYDGANEYTTCATILAGSEEGYGTPSVPQVLNFTSASAQTVELAAGTNWFSTNLDITLDELKAALVSAAPSNTTIKIKSSTQTTQYSRGHWNGVLDWDVAKMYKIEVASPCEISLEGSIIDPAEHPITIAGGGLATWIGFPLTESMTPTIAFANIVLSNDRVKSASNSAQYSRGRWNGEFNLEPNKGYIYISAPNAEDRVLVYPTQNK